MNENPASHCTFIIRSQVEYSMTSQTVSLRCLLETSTTGQRRGFTDIAALLTALQAALMEMHNQIIPLNQQKPEV